jgi:protein TonB|tara:strand:+ start:1788 stop:2402 length:615 start_codon:yes stop_codon:yes gene_type:complete
MTKTIKEIFIGIISAIVVFSILALIIKPSLNAFNKNSDFRVVDFIRLKKDTSLQEKQRVIPKKPEPPKKPPPPDLATPDMKTPPKAPALDIDFPDIDIPNDFGGAFLGAASAGAANSQLIPLVRINPNYPREQLMGGVEGYVTIRFTVTDDGTVSNPKVIESRPPRVFDRAALAAIKRWKFRPKFVNGVAVEQNGVQTIEFTIY